MDWFYALDGRQAGPVSTEELDRLYQAGTVKADTLVWHNGLRDWQPIQSLRSAPPVINAPAAGPGQMLCVECRRPFNTSDMIRFENHFVCAACKPTFFQKLREGIVPGGSSMVWRSGKHLVMRKEATLPHQCVKCGDAAGGTMLRRKLFWHHPALYFMIIFPGLLIYAIVATIVGKRAKIMVGLCERHRSRRATNLAVAWSIFGGSIVMFVLAAFFSSAGLVAGGVVALLVSAVYGMTACSVVTPKKIDKEFVWLNGVSPKFLDGLAEFPGPR